MAEDPRWYPNTFQSFETVDAKFRGPKTFDPALKQFAHAFRRGDPAFADPALERAWRGARRRVMGHLLELIQASPWRDHLVLRGSLLLTAWLGEAARDPGDLDWVFQPVTVKKEEPEGQQLFDDLIRLVSEQPRVANVTIDATRISQDDIWTYERASGRRIVFPFTVEGLPPGAVQMDVVFGEEIPSEPLEVDIPLPRGRTVRALAVSIEQSLAWKLLWLATDGYPQGKDLYDATLLAEQAPLPFDLLRKTFEAAGENPKKWLEPDFPLKWWVDWESFQQEYPWVQGEARDWQVRLHEALALGFEVAGGRPD